MGRQGQTRFDARHISRGKSRVNATDSSHQTDATGTLVDGMLQIDSHARAGSQISVAASNRTLLWSLRHG